MTSKEGKSFSTDEDEHQYSHVFSFQEGNKLLDLIVHTDSSMAFTTIRKTEDPYEVGATTRVYELARDILEGIASASKSGILYQFYTEDPKLIAWAKDSEKGQRVFGWDEIIDYTGGVYALKHFPPSHEVK